MTTAVAAGGSAPIDVHSLTEIFRAAEKPSSEFRIGAESEKFGVSAETGEPLSYDCERGVGRVFMRLSAEHGWKTYSEVEGGPILALQREHASITLEPGAQFELSGAPLVDLHEIWQEQVTHLSEIAPVSRELGLSWLMTGFHPLARLDELPWVPKQRYPIMREYLPTRGSGALDMMQRTSTVQANFDWSSEADGMRKLRVTLRLAPLVHALFANAPLREGRESGRLSERGNVWMNMDPSRSGLIESLWDKEPLSYSDYVEWALDAGMFLLRRGDRILQNTGQTFRDFLENGFEGEQATLEDFRLHLSTLFPEVRLKNTLEVRSVDCLPPPLALAAIAVWTGVLYDARALDLAEELVRSLRFQEVQAARPELIRAGLHTELSGRSGWQWAEQLLEIARGGLTRRGKKDASGRGEEHFLQPIEALVARQRHPADEVLEIFRATGSAIQATRIELPEL